jgi:hypothetical protein
VIVGGMVIGTVLTLFVVPAAYSVFARAHRPETASQPGDQPARAPAPAS